MMHSFRSNADHTRLISKSIFITNFPDSTTFKDLWNLCQPYGTVVDVFIPNRKSKSGKRSLCNAQSDFAAKERIVWVDIEGVPLHAWSRSTFFKIGSKWGDVLKLEDDHDDLFARKRLCIKTKHEENILESFKIIVKGKVFCVRAKELFVWNPTFKDIPEVVHCLDDESIKGETEMNGEDSKLNNDGDARDSKVVSDTYFGDNADEQGYENEQSQSFNAKEVSKDPFNIYDLLNKTKKVVGTSGSDTSLPKSDGGNSRILEEVENIDGCFSSEGRNIRVKPKEGGSILDILDEMIKVGQTMGFSMEGCTKDMENIIGSKGVYEILR
ncbi:RNA-directed DNA polymerase, eukaryota [Tanacetum coccineum]